MLPAFPRSGSLPAALLALLVALAPLPWGSVTPGARLVVRLLGLALFLLTLWQAPESRRLRSRIPVAAAAALGALGLLQSVGWPAGLVTLVAPERAELVGQAAAGVGAAAPGRIALSLAPGASVAAGLGWLTIAAVLVAAIGAGGERRHRRWLLGALAGAALAQGAIGLARLAAGAEQPLAALLLRPEGRLRGTFTNPNHLSLFFEIALAVAVAWAWWAWGSGRRAPALARVGAPLAAAALLGLVVLTGSRAGLLAALAALGAQGTALVAGARRRRRAVAVAVVLAALAGAAIGVAPQRWSIQRYASVSLFEDNLVGRLETAGPALELWRRFPLTGTGLGSFRDVYPLVQRAERSEVDWNRAHNDWLELLVTGGLVGLGLAVLGALGLGAGVVRSLARETAAEERAAALAALGAAVAAAVHELFDFGLAIPANAVALLAVLGAAAGAPIRRREE